MRFGCSHLYLRLSISDRIIPDEFQNQVGTGPQTSAFQVQMLNLVYDVPSSGWYHTLFFSMGGIISTINSPSILVDREAQGDGKESPEEESPLTWSPGRASAQTWT